MEEQWNMGRMYMEIAHMEVFDEGSCCRWMLPLVVKKDLSFCKYQ